MNRALSAGLRVACGLVAMVGAALSLGAINNGNFASGSLAGWSSLGGASAVGTLGNIVPTAGNLYQAQIGSGKDSADAGGGGAAVGALGFNKPGAIHRSSLAARFKHPAARIDFADVTVGTIETTLNLPTGAIAAALPNDYPPTFGSVIYQSFSATAGTTLSFDWNYATNERIPSQYDAALYSLQVGANPAQVFELADSTQTGAVTVAGTAGNPFAFMTGYHTTSVVLPSTGTYTVGFISIQTEDDSAASATYVSNVQGGTSPPPQGPVPATWSLGLLGLGFIAIYSGVRRLRRAN